ncbi:hypothetical protein INS49_009605 [Diaporthe citri]|uniref:uncharacterized protein n=1 Tax=Diaporthe citri TaxID=83186 RepID=UPI001C80FC4B|nr:uncharacterized protein INS49_009605 [Diaporthe citri]KAG6361378.1 hypothetical protein INS49_009605 [Diaporthe citri]
MIDEDGNGDPFWGSAWMRDQQKLVGVLNDDDMVASVDLGVAWGLMVNMVPSVVMALIDLFEDQSMLDRVREEIQATYGQCPAAEFDIRRLSSMPLLHFLYAETLRLHVSSYSIVSAPDNDVPLGKWRLPKGGLVSSAPKSATWIKPSGIPAGDFIPCNRFGRRDLSRILNCNGSDTKPYVSMEGLEGLGSLIQGANLSAQVVFWRRR